MKRNKDRQTDIKIYVQINIFGRSIESFFFFGALQKSAVKMQEKPEHEKFIVTCLICLFISEDSEGDIDLDRVLVLYEGEIMPYEVYCSINPGTNDADSVREYATFVGRTCSQRMLLFRKQRGILQCSGQLGLNETFKRKPCLFE